MIAATDHSIYFAKIKKYYNDGYWPKKWVRDAVVKKYITKIEYLEIVGEAY